MANIENDRDLILQATVPRIIPILIPIDKIDGLPQALKSLRIKSSATTFTGTSGATNPATITLTAEKMGGLTGTVVWTVITGNGTLTPSGDECVVTGSSITGYSLTVRARVVSDGNNYDAQITLTKLGKLSEQETVDLTTQVTGKLNSGNVNGLGALALLNTVDLNTQTTGALNGQTQVTNLGTLAYANAIAADQIGAGTLAAGVIYAGTINADKINSGDFAGKIFTGGNFTGGVFQTSQSQQSAVRIVGDSTGYIRVWAANGTETFNASASGVAINGVGGAGIVGLSVGSQGPGVSISAANGRFALRLAPTSTLPPPQQGAIAYHSTHAFIFSEGTGWFKPTFTQVT